MAEKTITNKDVAEHRATPGSAGGQVRQEPLPAGTPRDALIDDGRNEADWVPDVDRLHVGLVKQPTVPIRDASGNVIGFLAQDDLAGVLKEAVEPPSITDLKQHHNRVESSKEWQAGIRPLAPAPLGENDSASYNREQSRSTEKKAATKSESKTQEQTPAADGEQK